MITADRLTTQLLTSYSSRFGPINQHGNTILGYKLAVSGGATLLVQLEVFDYPSWPQRPQYNIQTAGRSILTVAGHPVKIFSPEWMLREKILSQYQRRGSDKEATDLRGFESDAPTRRTRQAGIGF